MLSAEPCIQAAARVELFQRGTVRVYGTPDGESAVMSAGMLPAAFATASAAVVSRGIRERGCRPCSPLGLTEERPFRATLVREAAAPEARQFRRPPSLAPAASAAVAVGGTLVRTPPWQSTACTQRASWFPQRLPLP